MTLPRPIWFLTTPPSSRGTRNHSNGIAPDCGMKLEPVYADSVSGSSNAAAERKILHYEDPQDANYKSDKPGLNPATGNELGPHGWYRPGFPPAPGSP
jgi:hypothetical protein